MDPIPGVIIVAAAAVLTILVLAYEKRARKLRAAQVAKKKAKRLPLEKAVVQQTVDTVSGTVVGMDAIVIGSREDEPGTDKENQHPESPEEDLKPAFKTASVEQTARHVEGTMVGMVLGKSENSDSEARGDATD